MIGLVLALGVWPAAALGGNPHGSPPGQEKKAGGSGGLQGSTHAKGKAHVKSKTHARGSTHAKATIKVHGHVHARVGADVTGHSHAHANSNAAVLAHAKVRGRASVGIGVKPSSATAKNTFAAAASSQTKLYGNGKTAGEIAMAAALQSDTMLYGPGNSQPHKVSCGAHWIDVHALKAHLGVCAGAEGSMGASAQANLYGNGQTAAQIALQARFGGATLFAAGNSGLHKVSCGGHLIDVHALKAHACAGSGAGAKAGGQVSAGVSGQTQGTAHARAQAGAGAKGGGVLGASSARPKSSSSAGSGVLGAATSTGTLPFTGLPLWLAVVFAAAIIAGGLGLRRAARAHA